MMRAAFFLAALAALGGCSRPSRIVCAPGAQVWTTYDTIRKPGSTLQINRGDSTLVVTTQDTIIVVARVDSLRCDYVSPAVNLIRPDSAS